ncbi:MAG: hypothetical protein GX144_01955 [Clostridiaceae bacterium]|nr:hypothetical protein [Clostridiaceae bacterium]
MNGNAEMLNFIYQNAEMGIETINKLIEVTEDEDLKKHLQAQYEGYSEINREARSMLNKHGYDEKGIGTLERIRTYLMLNIQTMMDKTSSHIAEMLIVGSNMGVINAVKNIKKYQDAEKDIVGLMERLLRFEEDNIQQLKKFL